MNGWNEGYVFVVDRHVVVELPLLVDGVLDLNARVGHDVDVVPGEKDLGVGGADSREFLGISRGTRGDVLGVELEHVEDLVVGGDLLVMDDHKLLRMNMCRGRYVEIVIHKAVVDVILHHLEVLLACLVQHIPTDQKGI